MSETQRWSVVMNDLKSGTDLSRAESAWAMDQIISGTLSEEQMKAFLIALTEKGEQVEEILGFRDAVLRNALPLDIGRPALDIVGTGGDKLNTVNVSSTAAIICAAAGVPVLKHGNRAASSASGSSDVYSQLGVNLDLSTERVEEIFTATGMGFAFAAKHHPGFRHVANVRRELGIPTVFNILGPLCNPANPVAACIGVASEERVQLVVRVLQADGQTALVIRGDDGMDELTTTGLSQVWQVTQGEVSQFTVDPQELGITRSSLRELAGGTPEQNARTVRDVLSGATGAVRDIVSLNAAAGMTAFELAIEPETGKSSLSERLRKNLHRAYATIDSGAAESTLNEWITATQKP